MESFLVTVEERVSQDFVIQADSQEEAEELAQKLYKNGDLVLEPGNLLDVSFSATDLKRWCAIHPEFWPCTGFAAGRPPGRPLQNRIQAMKINAGHRL